MYFTHAHLIRRLAPGQWIGLGVGYEFGGANTIIGINKGDRKRNIDWAVNYSYPLSRSAGIKLTYIGTRAQADTGFDSETLALSAAFAW